MQIRLVQMIAFLLFIANSANATGADGSLVATDLRCEYLVDPLAVASPSPRLSWIVDSSVRGDRQTAYRILVASTPEVLARDRGDLWDTGRVASDHTAQIVYDGRALSSRMQCWWKVRVWDRDHVTGAWSDVARWETGLRDADDWSAKWIDASPDPVSIEILQATYGTPDGAVVRDVTDAVRAQVKAHGPDFTVSNDSLGGDPAYGMAKELRLRYRCAGAVIDAVVPENATAALPGGRIPYLRRPFTLSAPVRSARLYATALGVYELHLNGRRVGDQHLAPGWTDYRKRVYTQVYDVTGQVRAGANTLGAIVGPGWFCGHAGLFNAHNFYGQAPALLVQLEIRYEDGSTERVVTDDSWRRHPGPILRADLLKGDIEDAASVLDGWDQPDQPDEGWMPVTERDERRTLEPELSEPVRVLATLPAISVTEPAPGRWTFDLGQNMVGVARLRIDARPGTVITLRHGEVLNRDGTIYTRNLRAATSTDTYICRGGGVEIWQPRFTFHGFRYVEVTGLDERPPLDTITGIVIGSDVPVVGSFTCSDERINRLQQNIQWGLRGNYLSVPTDCPQRDERMGWMADAQVFVPTAIFNADIAAFMIKWMVDVDDAQRADGAYSDVAPAMSGLSFGTPAWADAGVIVPWQMYQSYGDVRILERHIDSMTHWVDWCHEQSDGLIRSTARGNDYGDWLSMGADTSKELIGTAYFARSADLVARSLRVLGRDAEAARYEALFEAVRDAFRKAYVGDDTRILGDTQTSYLLALDFGLLDDGERPRAIAHLVDDIDARNSHLSTGFLGVGLLLPVLTGADRTDVAWRLLFQDAMPSWLFPVTHGATTVWERWNGWTPETGPHPDWGMNSFNHYALGSCGRWFFEGIAGITHPADSPGFTHITVQPHLTAKLDAARAEFRSIRGTIVSGWNREESSLHFEVIIPANVKATLRLPAPDPANVFEGGVAASKAAGVQFDHTDGTESVWHLGSGAYHFMTVVAPGDD